MCSTSVVAAWGEEWLRAWTQEPGVEQSERERRAWVADQWRQLDIEAVMHVWKLVHDEAKDEADFHSENHLRLYMREQEGLLIWRARAEYRSRGLPVPEDIERKLDQWAERLEHASGAAEIARAIEMARKGGGRSGANRLLDVERRRRIVFDVDSLLNNPRWNPESSPEDRQRLAKEQVAKQRRVSPWRITDICAEWKAAARKPEQVAPAASTPDTLDNAVWKMTRGEP
jgi:hypothetical protein